MKRKNLALFIISSSFILNLASYNKTNVSDEVNEIVKDKRGNLIMIISN